MVDSLRILHENYLYINIVSLLTMLLVIIGFITELRQKLKEHSEQCIKNHINSSKTINDEINSCGDLHIYFKDHKFFKIFNYINHPIILTSLTNRVLFANLFFKDKFDVCIKEDLYISDIFNISEPRMEKESNIVSITINSKIYEFFKIEYLSIIFLIHKS